MDLSMSSRRGGWRWGIGRGFDRALWPGGRAALGTRLGSGDI